jgi:hypothetical protein
MRSTLSKVREDLLDLGLRNPLLNYRLLKTRGIEVAGTQSVTLYNALVSEKLELSFCSPEVAQLFTRDAADQHTADPLTQLGNTKTLPTPHSVEDLNKRLLATMYSAKSSIEEQGVNKLFLALGKLEWREPEDQEVPRFAPLVLIPVELNRENARAGFKLKYNDEDVIPNISLVRFLQQSFGVEIEEFSEDEDLDVAAYFASVAEEVSTQKGWSVHEDFAALGFFSFSKFLMYRDLDSSTWDTEAEILNHEVLNCLLGPSSFSDDVSQFNDNDFVDKHFVECPPTHVKDADSSQSLAILDVAAGRSMVIQGPPGTGKSQTIVNLIAGAIGSNRTVLLVAEKKAALDVVKSRIDELGLGPLCLELHSNKVKKKEVISELRKTYGLQANEAVDFTPHEAELEDTRAKLNEYAEAVNSTPGKSCETVHDLYGHFLPVRERFQGIDVPNLTLKGALAWSAADVKRIAGSVALLQNQVFAIGVPSKHLFWGTKLRVILPATEENIRQVLSRALEGARALGSVAERFGKLLNVTPPRTREELVIFCVTATSPTYSSTGGFRSFWKLLSLLTPFWLHFPHRSTSSALTPFGGSMSESLRLRAVVLPPSMSAQCQAQEAATGRLES